VIGQTTDEAVDAVDKFLDEASMASLTQVRIIHGHGTGALRRAIAELLKDHPHVARFAAAPQDQGRFRRDRCRIEAVTQSEMRYPQNIHRRS